MTIKNPNFILVDDDAISNFIGNKSISKAIPDAHVTAFTEPEKGLEFIASTFAELNDVKAILLLDINMPTMTGWEFMEHLEGMRAMVKDRLSIYILSSSVNPADKEKAEENPHIVAYLVKPLTANVVLSLA